MTDSETVLVDVAEGVAVVRMNRPGQRNALNRELYARLRETLQRLDSDDTVRVVILTGADPAFCAGVDLREAAEDGGVLVEANDWRGILPPTRVPLIGAVNGPAVTGGLELALCCDFLVASDRARFADTHARVGVMPGGGLTVRLARAIGIRRAKQMSVTGNFVDAQTAQAWGLVNQVVPHTELVASCRRLAADIRTIDGQAVEQILEMYDEGCATTENDAWDLEREVATAWHERTFDPAALGRRRDEVVTRGRSQL